MLRNYFKTALRSLTRNKNYTLINIAGLVTGIAVCAVMFLIIQFHSSYDNFHTKKDRIYRVLTEYHHNDSKDFFYGHAVPAAFPKALKTSFTEIEEVAPILSDQNDQVALLDAGNQITKKLKEATGIFYTNPSFFKIFDFPLLAGSYETLKDPNNVLLTKETAEKYYGNWKAALGKTIKINNTDIVKVTGILATAPANTDFQLKMVISYGTGRSSYNMNATDYDGTSGDFGAYILLPENISATSFNNQLKAYSKKVKSADNHDLQTIQPLRDVHFDTQTGDISGKTISHTMVNILWLIAAFILLIACVNFINLSTAQAVNRAKEVGVRKVMGSSKWQLQIQFIIETLLLVLISVIVGMVAALIVLPYVNNILELSLVINTTNAWSLVLFLAALTVIVTALAGFYPSIVLSGYNPINALKSKLAAKSTKGISLRRGLVVFQFIVAQSLIIGTLIIVKQMSFFTTQPLGFNKDAIVNIPLPTDSIGKTKFNYLKQQLAKINSIRNISLSSNTPVEDNTDNWSMFTFNHAVKQVDFYSIVKTADNDYVSTYELPLVAGRNLAISDTIREFLVNETVLKNLNIKNPEEALNKEVKFGDKMKGPIVGVLKDFKTRTFRDGLAPLIVTSNINWYNNVSIKLLAKDARPTMQAIEKLWNSTYPDFVFEYKFLDEKIDNFYKQESQLAHLYKIFAFIAILLSCLGLYGLASFMAVQRIKEVGIRKVLGASAGSIVYLFSKEFVVLIAIAFVIASPIAWYFMHQWLQAYPFRITISWWMFVVGGIASILIALATVSFQAIKAAMANPVKSLRTE